MNANEIQLKVVTQGYKDRLNKDAVDLVDHLVEKVNQQKDYDAKVRELGTFLNQRIVDEVGIRDLNKPAFEGEPFEYERYHGIIGTRGIMLKVDSAMYNGRIKGIPRISPIRFGRNILGKVTLSLDQVGSVFQYTPESIERRLYAHQRNNVPTEGNGNSSFEYLRKEFVVVANEFKKFKLSDGVTPGCSYFFSAVYVDALEDLVEERVSTKKVKLVAKK